MAIDSGNGMWPIRDTREGVATVEVHRGLEGRVVKCRDEFGRLHNGTGPAVITKKNCFWYKHGKKVQPPEWN